MRLVMLDQLHRNQWSIHVCIQATHTQPATLRTTTAIACHQASMELSLWAIHSFHRITEWPRLKKTTMTTEFQPPAVCRVANHYTRLPRATSSLALNACRDGFLPNRRNTSNSPNIKLLLTSSSIPHCTPWTHEHTQAFTRTKASKQQHFTFPLTDARVAIAGEISLPMTLQTISGIWHRWTSFFITWVKGFCFFFFLLLYAFHCSLRVKFTSCFSQGGCQTTTQPTTLGFTWLIALASCMTPPKQSPCSAAQSLDTCEISTPCSWDAEGGETFLHFTFPRKVGFAARRGVAFCGAIHGWLRALGRAGWRREGAEAPLLKQKEQPNAKAARCVWQHAGIRSLRIPA